MTDGQITVALAGVVLVLIALCIWGAHRITKQREAADRAFDGAFNDALATAFGDVPHVPEDASYNHPQVK